MPLVSIEVIKQYSKEEEITLMHAVNSAFKLSDDAINIRLFTHEPHRFFISPTEAKLEIPAELHTIINIDCYPGRTTETKSRLYRLLIDNLQQCGIPKDHLNILLRESSLENWGDLGEHADSKIGMEDKVEV